MKDINRKSGKGAATCPFYNELDSVLGTRAASNPVELIESSASTSSSQSPNLVIGMPKYCSRITCVQQDFNPITENITSVPGAETDDGRCMLYTVNALMTVFLFL